MLSDIIEPARLLTFAGIWLAAAIAPGGNVAFTVSVSSRYGFWAGVIGATGFISGLFFYMILVAFGLNFAVGQFEPILEILQWIGVLYLLYLAWRMWIADTSVRLDGSFAHASPLKIYVQGALICLTNPKAIIFMTVIFPQTIDPFRPLILQLIALGLTGAMVTLFVQSGYSYLGQKLGKSVPSPHARMVVNRLIAGVFVIAAVGLIIWDS